LLTIVESSYGTARRRRGRPGAA